MAVNFDTEKVCLCEIEGILQFKMDEILHSNCRSNNPDFKIGILQHVE